MNTIDKWKGPCTIYTLVTLWHLSFIMVIVQMSSLKKLFAPTFFRSQTRSVSPTLFYRPTIKAADTKKSASKKQVAQTSLPKAKSFSPPKKRRLSTPLKKRNPLPQKGPGQSISNVTHKAYPKIKIRPHYPKLSRRLGEEGTVKIQAHVNAFGKVNFVKVTHSSGYQRLDQAAVQATEQSHFIVAKLKGRPYSSITTVVFLFQLKD